MTAGGNLKLDALSGGNTPKVEVLYVPTSYYKKLMDSTAVISSPYNIEISADFSSKDDRDQYSILDCNDSDITVDVFGYNDNYKDCGTTVSKDIVGDSFEFQVRPSKLQRDNYVLLISLPLLPKFVLYDREEKILRFRLTLLNRSRGDVGDKFEFVIKPCNPVLEDKIVDKGLEVELDMKFSASVRYLVSSTKGDEEYTPPGKQPYTFYFEKPLNRGTKSKGESLVAVKFVPRLKNKFDKTHLVDDFRRVLWKVERCTDAREVDAILKSVKKISNQKVELNNVKIKDNIALGEKTKAEIHLSSQTENDVKSGIERRIYRQRSIPEVKTYESESNLHIKVSDGQNLTFIAHKIAMFYDKKTDDILKLIVRTNYVKGSPFHKQVKKYSKYRKTRVQIDGSYYDCRWIQPGLEFMIPKSKLE